MRPLAVVDTNILVRLITFDVPELAEQAEQLIEGYREGQVELPLYVLAEVVYVLAYNPHYQYSRDRINQSLFALVSVPQFAIERDRITQALNLFSGSKLDFVDCLVITQSLHHTQKVLTFDKKLQKELERYQ